MIDMLAYCKAMAAFCRQRIYFDGEDADFWQREEQEWAALSRRCETLPSFALSAEIASLQVQSEVRRSI